MHRLAYPISTRPSQIRTSGKHRAEARPANNQHATRLEGLREVLNLVFHTGKQKAPIKRPPDPNILPRFHRNTLVELDFWRAPIERVRID